MPVDIHSRRVVPINDTALPLPGLGLHHRLPFGLRDDRAADEERSQDRHALLPFVGAAPLLREWAPHREAASGEQHELHPHRIGLGPTGPGAACRLCRGGLLRGGFGPRRGLLRRERLVSLGLSGLGLGGENLWRRSLGWRRLGLRSLGCGGFLEGHRESSGGDGPRHFTRSPGGAQPAPPDHSSSMWRLCMIRWTNGAIASDATPMKTSPENRA